MMTNHSTEATWRLHVRTMDDPEAERIDTDLNLAELRETLPWLRPILTDEFYCIDYVVGLKRVSVMPTK